MRAKKKHLGNTAGNNLTDETGGSKTEHTAHQTADYQSKTGNMGNAQTLRRRIMNPSQGTEGGESEGQEAE